MGQFMRVWYLSYFKEGIEMKTQAKFYWPVHEILVFIAL